MARCVWPSSITEALKKEGGVQVQLQAETSEVPGCRPGNAEGPPVPVRKQAISQVDWPFQSNGGPWEWSIEA